MQTRCVGVLTQSSGTVFTELHLERPVHIGSLTALVDWRHRTGLQLLVLMPLGQPAPEVKKAGRRQAGAFLLMPGESFSVKAPDGRSEVYTFAAEPLIPLLAEAGALCGFCRAALQPNAPAFALSSGKQGPSGRLLCRACASAWQTQAGTDLIPIDGATS
jgi:hypothetical protein